jgi:hypothetical protein
MPREPALRITCHGPRTSLPYRVFHSTDHVQKNISPTDNQTQSVVEQTESTIVVEYWQTMQLLQTEAKAAEKVPAA